MVAVVRAAPASAAPQAVAAWLDSLAGTYPRDDIDALRAAFDYMQQRADAHATADGEKLVDRALVTAGIVAGLKLDPASIRGALLAFPQGAGESYVVRSIGGRVRCWDAPIEAGDRI